MKPADIEWLRLQWGELMDHYEVDPGQGEAVFDDLVVHYEENGRYYHTLRHIQNVLETVESFRAQAQDIRAIQLAAWFHDVIYDVHRSDNEAQSAAYAGRVLRRLGIPAKTMANVESMIQATKHNGACPADVDCQIILDADLASFASDWATQEEIEWTIRQEYAFVPEAVYREARQAILQSFLNRERIYCTDQMHAEREAAARKNIERSIAALDKC